MANEAKPAGKGDTKPGGTLVDDTTVVDTKKGDDGTATGGDKPKTADEIAAEKKTADDAAAAAIVAKKKTDDDAAAAAAAAQKDPGGKAPDKYELTLPEGSEAHLDESDLKSVETLARAKGWTNAEAQNAIEEHAVNLANASKAFRAITEKDETYGGDHLPETQRLAKLALDKLAPASDPLGKELRRDLARSGFGNKLSVIAMLVKAGKAFDEDSPGNAAASQNLASDAATAMYGKTSPKG